MILAFLANCGSRVQSNLVFRWCSRIPHSILSKSRILGTSFQTLIRGSRLPINGGRIYFSPDQSIYLVAFSIRAKNAWQNVVLRTLSDKGFARNRGGYEIYFSRRVLWSRRPGWHVWNANENTNLAVQLGGSSNARTRTIFLRLLSYAWVLDTRVNQLLINSYET